MSNNLKVFDIDLSTQEDVVGVALNVNIDKAFQDFLGKDLTTEFSKDPSLQNISNAISLLLEKYINKKCESDKKKPK